jgi:histidyl-tRNA synthetase
LNTLGNTGSRAAYRDRLVAYLADHRNALSGDSRARLERNPLRILDSKDKGDREIITGAPDFTDSLDAESTDFFAAVCDGLGALGIGYSLNARLVRGLDYYCHTAFEFTTEALGAQGTVLAGGRYDGLVSQMGGAATPGVGWAAGIERLALLADRRIEPARPIAVIPVTREMEQSALVLANNLRRDGFVIELAYRGNLSRRMKRASRLNARAAVIMGPDEAAKGAATLRDFDSGTQAEVPLDTLAELLAPFR